MFLSLVFLAFAFEGITGYHLTDTRIIGGDVVGIEQYPHQASLQDDNYHHICGAVIVRRQFLLTAAHCLRYVDPKGKKIRVGSTIYNTGGFVYDVESFAFHPRHNYIQSDLDIGIIRVTKGIIFNGNVKPIELIPENQAPSTGEMVNATGWGVSQFKSQNSSLQLRGVRIPVLSRETCAKAYEDYEEITITENMLCAGGSSRSVYSGDSGGPLINSKNQLVGIVSWGRKNQNLGFPSVFTNIASPAIRKFIKEKITI